MIHQYTIYSVPLIGGYLNIFDTCKDLKFFTVATENSVHEHCEQDRSAENSVLIPLILDYPRRARVAPKRLFVDRVPESDNRLKFPWNLLLQLKTMGGLGKGSYEPPGLTRLSMRRPSRGVFKIRRCLAFTRARGEPPAAPPLNHTASADAPQNFPCLPSI